MRPKEKIMYIEYKGDDGIFGAARIGRVRYSKQPAYPWLPKNQILAFKVDLTLLFSN